MCCIANAFPQEDDGPSPANAQTQKVIAMCVGANKFRFALQTLSHKGDKRIAPFLTPTIEYVCGKLPHRSPVRRSRPSDSDPRTVAMRDPIVEELTRLMALARARHGIDVPGRAGGERHGRRAEFVCGDIAGPMIAAL
jgi:hypothetical protein